MACFDVREGVLHRTIDAIRTKPLQDGSELRRLASCFPTGVAVVTTKDEEGRIYGTTMNSVTSLSLDPPLYLMCFGPHSNTYPVLVRTRSFCLNFLSAYQEELARHFAIKGADKTNGVGFSLGKYGMPILDGVIAACEGRVIASYPGGDHVIVVGNIESTHVTEGEPLVFYRGHYRRIKVASADYGNRRPAP